MLYAMSQHFMKIFLYSNKIRDGGGGSRASLTERILRYEIEKGLRVV